MTKKVLLSAVQFQLRVNKYTKIIMNTAKNIIVVSLPAFAYKANTHIR